MDGRWLVDNIDRVVDDGSSLYFGRIHG